LNPSQIPTTGNLSSRLREQTIGTTDRLGLALHRRGIHPDTITLLGLAVTAVAAVLVAQGAFLPGVLVLIAGLPLDLLDGAVARAMKRTGAFGGVLDSTIDRYADLFILLALGFYCAQQGLTVELVLVFASVIGSTQVSYIRARAGSAGLPCAGGLFSRFERSVVLVLTLLTGWLTVGLAILAVGSNLTALHRLWSVYRFALAKNEG